MEQPGQSYTVIETAYGFLFFTHTAEGLEKEQKFLQRLADRYFDPHFNPGPLRVYRAEGVLKAGKFVDPGESISGGDVHCRQAGTPETVPVYQNEMRPTPEDYDSFCRNAHCSVSLRNRNITGTLESLERMDRELSELSRLPATPDVRARIKDTGREKGLLDKLFKQYYDVRGHRTVENILNDPTDSVPVDGVRLFTPHRQVLAAGHCLFLPGEAGNNPSHSYAWVNGDFTRIVFSGEPPGNKQVFKVKTVIEKALNKKREAEKKKKNIHPKL